ncbi:nicotinate-nucleotide adenylyltransferase [Peribacillus alkalitolerans]|uniref:nicotinate-nucleotide adenylyltransferase n=1 Tax=Peribacillus alkalitolerans TaxID=1550385 RepID=UPI0013D2EE33|nr:nicotinate-nucleotide adenylyltransferase [Peribacillus alkalitolerans]
MKKKIGILGGTFDPPHIGHLIIANEVLHSLGLEEIRFMPNSVPPHKEKTERVSNQARVDMLELAINGNNQFLVEAIELNREGPSYTYDTIKLLKQKNPDLDIHFIIGADMIEYLPNWYKIDELVNMVQFVGVKRPTYNEASAYPIKHVQTPELFISSSMIRERLNMGMSIRYLVPEQVESYIKEHGLYES